MRGKVLAARSRSLAFFALCLVLAALLSGCIADATFETTVPQQPPVVVATQTPPPSAAPDEAPLFESASVVRVIDGDTIEVRLADNRTERVRFIGVDTPEDTTKRMPFGPEATAYTTDALEGMSVYLEYDVEARDKYDRLLAYVWLERPAAISDASVRGAMFNAHLLLEGYAQLLTIPPNVAYVDYFTAYQAEAREAALGLWSIKEDDSPSTGAPGKEGAIDWSDAAAYVGQRVTVLGPVAGAHFASSSNGQPTFLNIGRDYPDAERFTVVIWGEDRSRFASPPEKLYTGKRLRVTGEVSLYRGAAQIVVSDPGQIEVAE